MQVSTLSLTAKVFQGPPAFLDPPAALPETSPSSVSASETETGVLEPLLALPSLQSAEMEPAAIQFQPPAPVPDVRQQFQQQMQAFAQRDPEALSQLLQQVYGSKLSPELLNTWMERAAQGNFPFPEQIRFVDDTVLQAQAGAYAPMNGGTMLLNQGLLHDPEALMKVVLEEAGHHLDHMLGGPDAQGDEGQMLALGFEKGGPLSDDELTALRNEQDQALLEIDGQQVEVEHAIPVVAFWLGKAAAATTVDAMLEFGIAALTGVPAPGVGAHVGNFLMNAVPGLGEWNKTRKIARLTRAIDNILDMTRSLQRLPGSAQYFRGIQELKDQFFQAVHSGNLSRARDLFGQLSYKLREAQDLVQIGSRFDRQGINTSIHFRQRVLQRQGRGVTEQNALQAYRNGRLYFDPESRNYIRYDSRTQVAVVVDRPNNGTAITAFEGNPSPRWNPVRSR